MLIRSLFLGATAAVALSVLGCSPTRGTRSASAPPRAIQTPARAADNMNAGAGYDGGDPANVNRPGASPTSVGGGPASETMEHSDMDHSGVDPWSEPKKPATDDNAPAPPGAEPPASKATKKTK